MKRSMMMAGAIVLMFGLGMAAAMALRPAEAAPRQEKAPATITVQPWGDGQFMVFVVQDGRVYAQQYPGYANEWPMEIKPWGVLKE
jgi:hypothetical protein